MKSARLGMKNCERPRLLSQGSHMCRLVLPSVCFIAIVFWPVALAGSRGNAGPLQTKAAPKPGEAQIAFWYEPWTRQTWSALQPANIFLGVPPQAVAEIHAHGGKALPYVTFYQAQFGNQFLTNAADLSNTGFHTSAGYLPSAFGGKDNYVLCPNSASMHSRALAYVSQALASVQFDGLFIDNTFMPPASSLVCDAKHPHVDPGENGGDAYIDLLKDIYALAKKIKPGALIITNPGNPNSFNFQSHGASLWDISDYVLWESYGYASKIGAAHDRWKQTIDESFEFVNSPRNAKILVLSYPKTQTEALYSYAVAKTFGFEYAANLGVSEQGKEATGGHYGTFISELPQLSGKPMNSLSTTRNTVLTRDYVNGSSFLNLSATPFRIAAPRNGVLYTEAGMSPVKKGKPISLGPGKAAVFIIK